MRAPLHEPMHACIHACTPCASMQHACCALGSHACARSSHLMDSGAAIIPIVGGAAGGAAGAGGVSQSDAAARGGGCARRLLITEEAPRSPRARARQSAAGARGPGPYARSWVHARRKAGCCEVVGGDGRESSPTYPAVAICCRQPRRERRRCGHDQDRAERARSAVNHGLSRNKAIWAPRGAGLGGAAAGSAKRPMGGLYEQGERRGVQAVHCGSESVSL